MILQTLMKRLLTCSLIVAHSAVFGLQIRNPIPNLFGLGRGAFDLGRLVPEPVAEVITSPLQQQKQALLDAVSFTSNGKTATPEQQSKVLEIVRKIETTFPPSSRLLSDAGEAAILDGVWYLQYTSPGEVGDEDRFPDAWKPKNAKEGEANIETTKFKAQGSVSAAGIPVETANRVVQQIINVRESRVTNDIELEWGRIVASGRFRQSPSVPNRALVTFDTFKIQLNNGFGVDIGFLFPLLLKVSGSKENGWLETTFIDRDLRIARGNKGTMFVLTRDLNEVKP